MRQVRRPWMRKHGLQGYLCRIVKVTGESMEPTLPDGASILAPGGRDSMRTLRVTPHAEQIELGVNWDASLLTGGLRRRSSSPESPADCTTSRRLGPRISA